MVIKGELILYFYHKKVNVIFVCCSCADRNDMLEACDSRNLDVLQKEFPL